MNYEIIRDVPNHVKLQDEITLQLWPEFMLHDPVSNNNWLKLFELFPEYQISLKVDDEIVGVANCISYYWNKTFKDLPERGWDWVFEKGISDKTNGIKANTFNGLQIAVAKDHQGKGISSIILKEMIKIAHNNDFKHVTIPIRPSLKSKYPLTSIDNYIKWEREDGLTYDPWLRVHTRAGGEIIKPCHEAMYIPGTVAEWEEWTGLKFFESDDYIIPGALNPVKIDIEKDIGEYVEPNVWILHEV